MKLAMSFLGARHRQLFHSRLMCHSQPNACHPRIDSTELEPEQFGKVSDSFDEVMMRVGLQLEPSVCASGHSDNQTATRAVTLLEIGGSITDFRHSFWISDFES
jgi:hypothetical protein